MISGMSRPFGARAPLVEHPVVVRLDAEVAELLVLALGERLAAEAREAREHERRLDVVHVHVLEARLWSQQPLRMSSIVIGLTVISSRG